jgi:hypothetical protein
LLHGTGGLAGSRRWLMHTTWEKGEDDSEADAACGAAQAADNAAHDRAILAGLSLFRALLDARGAWPEGHQIAGDEHAVVVMPEGNYPPYIVCESALEAVYAVLREACPGGWLEHTLRFLRDEMRARMGDAASASVSDDTVMALAAWLMGAERGVCEG